MEGMQNQKRRYFRLLPSDVEPILVHIDTAMHRTIDISISGIKVEISRINPEWEIEKVINLMVELPEAKFHPRIHIKGRICYLDKSSLGVEFTTLSSIDSRVISEYILRVTKRMGYW